MTIKKQHKIPEEKSISVSFETWKNLQTLRIASGYRTVEDVILKLLGEKQ